MRVSRPPEEGGLRRTFWAYVLDAASLENALMDGGGDGDALLSSVVTGTGSKITVPRISWLLHPKCFNLNDLFSSNVIQVGNVEILIK